MIRPGRARIPKAGAIREATIRACFPSLASGIGALASSEHVAIAEIRMVAIITGVFAG